MVSSRPDMVFLFLPLPPLRIDFTSSFSSIPLIFSTILTPSLWPTHSCLLLKGGSWPHIMWRDCGLWSSCWVKILMQLIASLVIWRKLFILAEAVCLLAK
jgi:hypothetical protein